MASSMPTPIVHLLKLHGLRIVRMELIPIMAEVLGLFSSAENLAFLRKCEHHLFVSQYIL